MSADKIFEVIKVCDAAAEYVDLTDEFKSLRNFTTCREHQEVIHKYLSNGLLGSIFLRLERIASKIVHQAAEDLAESDVTQLRFGIQFLGNAVANCNENKEWVWPQVLPILSLLLESPDLASSKYALMVFYNCILNVPEHVEHFLIKDSLPLIKATLKLTFDDNCEWGLFLIENLLKYPQFLSLCCNDRIPQQFWCAILQFIHSKIFQENSSEIHLSNLFFLEKRFISETNTILSPNPPVYNTDKLREIVDILDVLCAASSADSYASHMKAATFDRNPANLLCHTIAVLKGVHLVTHEQTTNTSATSIEELCNIPTYNFQKSLITLIANLCFKNVHLQNKLREVDGIPLLLDCSKLNAKIPFITQWVVFAIRNACEDNKENQDLIAKMNKLGLTDYGL
ncbi:Ataxin-10 [Chamberlinius hualienensis]